MSKILITADWHIKLWSDRKYSDDGIPFRLIEILNAIRQMLEYAKTNKIETIVVAGDINDTKEVVSTKAFALLNNLLQEYPELSYIFVHGNHDSSSKSGYLNKIKESQKVIEDHTFSGASAIELLSVPKSTLVIDAPLKINNITFMPHNRKLAEWIRDVDENDILISHFGISDATLSNGFSIMTGISSIDLRKKFKKIILGHYHKPQQLGDCYYVGNPVPTRRDESDEEKRFLIIDTETLEVESIPTTGYRQYFNFILDDVTKVDDVLKDAEKKRSEGHFVYIRKKISDAVEIPIELNMIDESEEEYQMRGLSTSMKDEEKFKKYIEIMKIPEKNTERYLNVARRILELSI